MKVILIDDEKLGLAYLEHLLQGEKDVDIVGKYMNPWEGIEAIEKQEIDVLFLDIHIPGANGLDIAKQLAISHPALQIVFVSGFGQYAVDAFELNVIDFLVKPVFKKRLALTLSRIRLRIEDQTPIIHEGKLTLLGQVSIAQSNELKEAVQLKTSKTQQLFLYLIHKRGSAVRKTELIEMLWPDLDMKKAYSQLYNSIYLIRKELSAFENHIIIMNNQDTYRLELENMRVDLDDFQLAVQQLPSIGKQSIEQYHQATNLYTGNYLEEYDFIWAENERYRLQLTWVQTALKMVAWYVQQEEYDEAMRISQEICKIAPLVEEAYFYLMKIGALLHSSTVVHLNYRRLKEVLSHEIQDKPSSTITTWYEKWKTEGAIEV